MSDRASCVEAYKFVLNDLAGTCAATYGDEYMRIILALDDQLDRLALTKWVAADVVRFLLVEENVLSRFRVSDYTYPLELIHRLQMRFVNYFGRDEFELGIK
jgi:hypothetical protein